MNPQFQIFIQKIIQKFQNGQFDSAKFTINETLENDINSSGPIFELGLAFANATRLNEASIIFLCLLQYKKDDVRIPYNLGLIYSLQGNHQLALEAYDLALEINPDDPEVLVNKGAACNDLKNYELALKTLEKAIEIKPDIPEAWSNKAIALENLHQYDDVVDAYKQVIKLSPNFDWAYGNYLLSEMRLCSWRDFLLQRNQVLTKALLTEKVLKPFESLTLVDDVSLHQKVAKKYIQASFEGNPVLGPILKKSNAKKIRLAYFSADFRNHPVAFLIAELIELHDKERFELYAFSLAQSDDDMRRRLIGQFDHFLDLENKSDIEIAELARNLNIDIAVDLTGFTKDARTGVFAMRAAPIQINYLGYPGTMGADYMDYIVADKILITPDTERFYSEKIIYMPNSYQANDRKRVISDTAFTRQGHGLPASGFVFCCFNNNFKILPEIFDGWMRILKSVEGSVLWLLADNPTVELNLKIEADKRGVDPSRIIFAERMSLPDHLARHRLADLFIDTFPYNAHTTASDALWCGLPVLTLMGRSFASRVAASLLNAIGLPELITETQEDYEKLAVELSRNPKKLAEINQRLANNRLTKPLFDTPLFAKHLEAAYQLAYLRCQSDLMPDHITSTQ